LIALLRQIDQTFKQIKEDNNILSEEIFPESDAGGKFNSDNEDRFNSDDDELPF